MYGSKLESLFEKCPKLRSYLPSIGLFSVEIFGCAHSESSCTENEVEVAIKRLYRADVDRLAQSIAGRLFVLHKRPGGYKRFTAKIHHLGRDIYYLGQTAAIARIFYEILNSGRCKDGNPVKILKRASEQGGRISRTYARAKPGAIIKLKKNGLIYKNEEAFILTPASREILSEETQRIWEMFSQEPFRVKLYP